MPIRTTALVVAGVVAASLMGCAAEPTSPTTGNPYALPTVQLRDEMTPPKVWEALRALGHVGDPTDGCECLSVPVNTVVDIPGGTWTATPDGPRVCQDWTTTGTECLGHEFLI